MTGLYFGIFFKPDVTIQKIVQAKPVFLALLLLTMTHLAIVLGIPFGLPVMGIGSPYNEAISGFEVALLSGIVTIGLVHLMTGIAHGTVRLTGGKGNYLGLLAAFAFIGCFSIIILPLGLLYEWAMRQENALIVLGYPIMVPALLTWASVLGVLAVKRNYGAPAGIGVVAVVMAGALAMPFALILYALAVFIPCPPMVGC